MEGWDTVKELLLQNDFLVRIDLKDAYLSVPIAAQDRPWLCFLYQGTCYHWNVLPFGLRSAPRVFTKIMRPVVAFLRSQGMRLVIFLGDILIMDQSPSNLESHTQSVVHLLHSLGFIVNVSKSHLTPSQQLIFLGFEIRTSSLSVCLPKEKGLAIKQFLDSMGQHRVRAQVLAKAIGHLNATSLAVLEAPLHLRSLQLLLIQALRVGSYETIVTLSADVRQDLVWWRNILPLCPSRSLRRNPVVQVIQTDSSLQGWGACSQTHVIGRQWSCEQSLLHINELELVAAFLGLGALGRVTASGCILLQLDNKAAVAAINRMGSVRSPRLNKVALQLWSWCLHRGMTVRAQHIPGNQNLVADQASRFRFDSSSWKLHSSVFRKINHLWGPISTDLFADLSNYQVPHYFSWKPDPGAAGIDAFSQDCANLAGSSVVPHSPPTGLQGTSGCPTSPRSVGECQGSQAPPNESRFAPSSVESVEQHRVSSSLSGDAANLLAASRRKGTRLAYDSCWRKWSSWCGERSVDPFSPPLTQVLNFLAYLHFAEHLAFRTICSYRSALSQTIGVCDGFPLGEHPSVSRLLKGVFHLNPPCPRYSSTWSVETVTSFLSSMGDNGSLPIRLLTYKLAMLLALATACRSADLVLFSLQGIQRRDSGWQLPLSGLRKTSRMSKPWPSVFAPALSQVPLLCPVRSLESYIARTLPYRAGHSQILLTTQKPFQPASRDTVANWLKRTLDLAGVDTSVFKAHSTRGAATSKAQGKGVPIAEILEVADWSSDTTFNRFYRRDSRARTQFGVQVLS
ncbi:uncharacterized protein LOC135398504 [Ornithodoros turicata]|uniref:uncharacterized protein LOC135398504 n=1 Tax=Ornithodoros turicata TaxID=34597 RepID=UPI0031392D8F